MACQKTGQSNLLKSLIHLLRNNKHDQRNVCLNAQHYFSFLYIVGDFGSLE